jgi:hypothetical protein
MAMRSGGTSTPSRATRSTVVTTASLSRFLSEKVTPAGVLRRLALV